ncbi:phosphosulfolactate synthase [Paenibacillus abyssi]|uniref:Phosphosulfolactate synthase n=1 Tax=Paenibacillus abyssi TaxID=1340531 RepID=A0A917FL60_9BACL|nr:phosphosulfolactate synthase [Paenibacillus abyssi]GGF86981.1 phosphosulfolactate synthase [Paenibacillus abyssi]
MEVTSSGAWHRLLCDPKGERSKMRQSSSANWEKSSEACGRTMIIDKGLGKHAYSDLIETAGQYVDCIKLGFGTSPLYSDEQLQHKIRLAAKRNILIMPGGTLLEAAVAQDVVSSFFDSVCQLGFTAIEVSDGTIELSRRKRTELIREGAARGLRVFTEYGKKTAGSTIDPFELADTAEEDLQAGADLVTVEARESGIGVGLFDEQGNCRQETFERVIAQLPDVNRILWEAPLKSQQVLLLEAIGSNVNLGNIPPADVIALEAMRRGLRSDTFPIITKQLPEPILYMI